jgi:hypothetical protein
VLATIAEGFISTNDLPSNILDSLFDGFGE